MVIGEVKVNKLRVLGTVCFGVDARQGLAVTVPPGDPLLQPPPLNGPQSLTCAFLNRQTRDVLEVIIATSLPPMPKCAVPFLSKDRNPCLSVTTIHGLSGFVCALCVGTRSSEMPSLRGQMYFRKAI